MCIINIFHACNKTGELPTSAVPSWSFTGTASWRGNSLWARAETQVAGGQADLGTNKYYVHENFHCNFHIEIKYSSLHRPASAPGLHLCDLCVAAGGGLASAAPRVGAPGRGSVARPAPAPHQRVVVGLEPLLALHPRLLLQGLALLITVTVRSEIRSIGGHSTHSGQCPLELETNLRETRSFTITEKALTRAFSQVNMPTSALTFKHLYRHYTLC